MTASFPAQSSLGVRGPVTPPGRPVSVAVNAAVQSRTAAARSPRRRASLARTHRPNGWLAFSDKPFGKIVATALVRQRSEAIEIGPGLRCRFRQDGFDRDGTMESERRSFSSQGSRGRARRHRPRAGAGRCGSARIRRRSRSSSPMSSRATSPNDNSRHLRAAGGLIGVEADGIGDQASERPHRRRAIRRNRPRRLDETRFDQVETRLLAEACDREPHGIGGAGLGIATRGLKGSTRRVRAAPRC